MAIYELLKTLNELRSDIVDTNQAIMIMKAHLEFEKKYLNENSNNPYANELHSKNITVLNDLLANIDRSVYPYDVLQFYYGHAIVAYTFANNINFIPLISEFQSQLSALTETQNIKTQIIRFFSLKNINGIPQFLYETENEIKSGNPQRIREAYLICRVLLYDESLMQGQYLYRGESRFGFYILFDILSNQLSGNMDEEQSVAWKEKFVQYCDKYSEIPIFYSANSKIQLALKHSQIHPDKMDNIISSIVLPKFADCPHKISIGDLTYLYGIYLIVLKNLSAYSEINNICEEVLQGIKELQYKDKWFLEYVYKYKRDALNIIDKNSKWFFEHIKEYSLEEIGTLAFLSPYMDNPVPEKDVYHFSDVAALKSIIDNGKLWLTRYDYLNDTEEMKYILDIIETQIANENNNFSNYVKECASLLKIYFSNNLDGLAEESSNIIQCIKNTISKVYVLSTSLKDDNLSLWHYYSGGTGASIHFNTKQFKQQVEFSNDSLRNFTANMFMREISYLENDNSKHIVKALHGFFEDSYLINKIEKLYLGCIHILFEGIFVKSKTMAQEEEYRIVIMTSGTESSNAIQERFRVKNENSFIPFIELNIFPQLLIEHIRIAPLNKSDLAKKGLVDYLTSKNYANADTMVQLSEIRLRY